MKNEDGPDRPLRTANAPMRANFVGEPIQRGSSVGLGKKSRVCARPACIRNSVALPTSICAAPLGMLDGSS